MDFRPSFFLGLILVLNGLSASQDTNEVIPEGASTLAFVFDVTGSMYDDLVQVIEGASKILETSLSRPQRPLYNFALVPFHDPEIGPITITTDPKKFQDELRELYVQGGGDCPEMSIGAIKIALEISLPGSYIYVFTDARSKDYKLTHDVLQLIQQKQSQVVFVLTGDCNDRSHIGYKVYEEIASTSSGQVFHLDKKQVNEVLKWVEEAVQSSKVHLLSTDHQNGLTNTWQIPFDPSLKEVTVALSGPNQHILLHIPNSAKVLNLKDPAPGMWTIKVMNYEGRHSVRISGLSTIDFRAGFSQRQTLDFKMTSSRPVQGIPTFILLNTTGLSPPARADRLELLNITGDVMKTLPIRYFPDRRPYGIWNITEFIPPKEAFFLRVTGYDHDGFVFQRVSSVSYFSIVPGQITPKVSMPTHTPGYYLQKGSVMCFVDSLIPYTVRFTREGLPLGVDQLFGESANASWGIPQVSLKDEGFYECIAISSAGTGRAQTFLDVSAIMVPSNATASPGANVILTCLVASTVRFNLTWQRGEVDPTLDHRMRVTANLSLEIQRVTPDDVGWYTCIAANEGGISASRVYLSVQEPPVVTVDPRNQTFSTGQEVWIRCSAKGYPLPMVSVVFFLLRHRMTPDGTLVIRKTGPKDAGTYGCLASNVAGTDTQTAIVSYIESPQVTVPHSDLLIGLGQLTILECRVTGVPHPDVLWYKGRLVYSLTCGHLFRGILSIQQTQDTDAGEYTCVAINSAGSAQGYITLDVGCKAVLHTLSVYLCNTSMKLYIYIYIYIYITILMCILCVVSPLIALNPTVVSVIEDQQVTLPCVLLAGNPLPERHWLHDNGLVTSSPYVSVRRDGSLHIERVSQQDGGQYTCLAENVVGSSNSTTILNVYVMPTIQHGPQVFSTIEGTPISLPCRAHGVPKPDITWSKVNLLDLSGSVFSLGEEGSLYIVSPSGEESGEFVCTATNAAGYSSRKPRLSGVGGTEMENNYNKLLEMSVKVGDDVTLPCELENIPPPIITWAKDKQLISPFSNRYQHIQLPSGSMRLTETRVTDSGMYLCVATNIAGNFTQTIKLSVLVPPSIHASPRAMKVQVGHAIDLPCVAQGVPEPSVSWLKDGSTLLDGSQYKISDEALTLNQVGLMDEGVYTCVASNIAGQDEATIQLHVSEPPFNSPLQERVANQQITFPCPAKGTPEPVIKWFRNGQELTGNEPGVSILEDGTLLILASVSPLDNGEYTCMAVNDAGTTEKKYQLKVNVPPDFRDNGLLSNVSLMMNQPTNLVCDVTGTPVPVITWYKDGVEVSAVIFESHDLSAVLNQEIILECRVKGDPFPTIQWYKDRKPVFLGDPNTEVLNRGQQLKIKSARLGDQARYQCSATNAAGKQSKDFNLSIFVPPSIKGGNMTTELTVLLGNMVTLECEVRGVPFPAITWYKNGEVILSSRQAQYVDRGQFLKISRAQVSDAGQYTCKVTSVAGTAEKVYELDVYVPPSITAGSDGPTDMKVLLSKSLILECEAEGHPPPSLTWLKDGSPVAARENLRVLEQGRKLEILSALPSDAGRYVCVATSIAGEREIKYDVSVLVPPIVDGASETTDATVILNNILELECYVTGTPTPTITWLKDGVAVRQGEGVQIMSNGRRLVISRAQVSDTALFHCVATNEAGEQEREFKVSFIIKFFFKLQTHFRYSTFMVKFHYFFNIFLSVPPTIHSMGPAERSVVLHTSVSLQCVVSGIPPPSITWLKDGRPVDTTQEILKLESAGRILHIKKARLEDAGKYTCVATNAAGEAQQHIRLNVHGRKYTLKNKMTILVGFQIQLKCKATGSPLPAVTWYKDGRPLTSAAGVNILSRGQVLEIDRAQVSDAGLYKCVAINVAGSTELTYSLQVYVPPNIVGEEVNQTVLMGQSVQLHCQSDAIPPPALSWQKDGRSLYRKPGLSLSEDSSLLKVHAQVQDTGRYTCEATNVAGKTEKHYNLNVWVRPFISSSAQDQETVTRGGDITLQCEADGIPRPAISWMKDGRPLSTSRKAQILNEGRLLCIQDALVADTGRYTCIAVNVAGQADRKYDLNVHVPPTIIGQTQVPENLSVVVKNPVVLSCEASGMPLPSITWLKDGQPISVMSNGRFLQISGSQVADTGRYSCLASNSAGDRSRHFNLNVLVSPTIAGSGPEGSAEEVTVTLNSPTSLVCEAQSYPPAIITWLKDGTPFESSRNVRVLPGGRTLQILNAKEEDAGRYTCVATNEAGETLKNYEVKSLSPKEVKIKVNNSLTLECEAQAIPTPTLVWYKDGQVKNTYTTGRIVQIKHTQVSDTGRYTCVATNIAGEDEKDFDVNIQGEQVSDSGNNGDMKDVILNNPISLYCETNAVPPPVLTWYKDGRLLTSNDEVLILPGGRVLQIPRAQAEDSGRYTCVAVNEAGEDSIQYDVRVLLPPSIRGADGDLPDEITVLVNKTTLLECQVDGSPTPKISWIKDSQHLTPDDTHRLLSSGRTLQILNAQVTDTGRYVCMAQNLAGTAEKSFNLHVHVSPSIVGVREENVTVVINNFISLNCEATGFPPPTLSWFKDRKPVQASSNALIMPGTRILKAKMSEGGKYSCVAINQAGEAQKLIYLTVYVPPSIRHSSGDLPVVLNVQVGKSVTLECESNAVPPPIITWYKNGRPITETANLRILADGQMLELRETEVSDTGQYVCKATNVAGQVDKNFHLSIHVPPRLDGPAVERVVETISNPITFACDATGIPPPSLTWLKNGRVIESLEMHILSGGSKLQIARSQLSDSGTYTCVASNVEGKAHKNYHLTIQVPPNIKGSDLPSEMSVLLNDSIQLVCRAEGNPTPEIQWLKDGKTLIHIFYRISPDGSTLTVTAVHTSDSGKYTCVATNQAGEEDRIFNLNVYVPPLIQGNGPAAKELTAVLDSSINIECVASGSPPPQLNWLKNGLPLPVSSQIRLLSAGQVLRIARAQVSDGGSYTCVASNRAGVDNRHYNLQVYVPPSLDGAGSTEEVTVVRGNTASFICIANGTPSPTITWLRNGAAMLKDAHLLLLNQNSTLQISHATVNHTGHYTCTAHNQAGDSSRQFSLKVLDPPQINGSGVPAEVSVVVNHILELVCKADGIPLPTLTWLKDGRPLPQTDSIRLLRDGEVLRVNTGRYTCLATSPAGDDDKEFLVRMSPRVLVLSSGRYLQINNAELGDGAQYTCVASNVAGESRRHFNLISPTIKDGPQSVSVHINQPVVLECVVNGVPVPSITWRKHGSVLAGNNPRYRFGEDGSLHILSAQVTDTGRYLCIATNQAGTERKRVDLQVYVPPSITEGPTNITVTVNVQTTLSCEATGIPKPSVRWAKNTQALNTDQNQNMYRLLSSGSLVVIAPTVEDTALYECVVSNEAGQESRAIQLTVHVPPSIADEATELVVSRLSPVVIGCTAFGVPHPVLYWSKDGLRLAKDGEGYTILPSGPLEITAADLSHSGRYSCVAKNAAGESHTLALMEVKMSVGIDASVTLQCHSEGFPTPSITWYKNGQPLSESLRQRVLSTGALQIAFAQPGDTGRYTCTAANVAGTTSLEMSLIVQIPSSIRGGESEVSVVENAQALLTCVADGVPQPIITWEKDDIALTDTTGEYTILPTGELLIDSPEDSGSYTCIGTNSAGQDSRTIGLSVHTHPAFTELLGDVALNKGERLLLTCGVTGIPPPKITWVLFLPTAQYDHVNGHSELVIERVSKDDSGTYSCVAENSVGSIKSLGFVYVKEPPIIDGDVHLNRIEPLGGNAILNCGVRGDPLPTIQWRKKGVNVQISNRIRQLDNGSLAIYGTVSEDAGNYMCLATNDAGVVERTVTLTLQRSPSITVKPVETVVDAGSTLVLNCQADGEPVPVIEWSRQGQPLLGNERITTLKNGSLRLSSAQKEDTAEYECVARNLLGSVLARVTLTVRGGPQKARGSIIGTINDVEFGIAILNATISSSPTGERVIQATITNIPRSLGPAMRKLISILNPIYWTTAQELSEAVNGYTLTDGIFRRETQVEFATGEILRMTHVARGLDSDGALLLDIVLNGHILQLPSNDYTEDYIQTGPGQLYALSTRMFSIDRVSVPYSWNHTITYRPSKGKMPYLVQTLHASAISALYRPLEEMLEFSIHATIAKGERSNQCPSGFQLDPAGPYCSGTVGPNPCSHACHNAVGTYYCSCPRGLTISADGRTCQDIDECSLSGHMCHDGQNCENTIGSYHCVMRCGRGFRRTADDLCLYIFDVCIFICHTCQESNPCHQHCLNTIGSFRCACDPGSYNGKSCAGLERLPSYESFSYGYRTSQSSSDQSSYQQRYHSQTSQSFYSYVPIGGRHMANRLNNATPHTRRDTNTCRPGFQANNDINECEQRDTCQHECMNTPGSHRCLCPSGYRLMANGKTCQDIDECLEQNIQCGANRMCFNMRGSYQCIDTPCPPNYQRDPATGFCLKNCPPNDLECALSPYALEYKLLSLPFGIAANQDLIRLVAYTQDGVVHPRTSFLVVDEDTTLPFAIRDENLKGVLFTTRPLREPRTYRMKVRALSYSADGGIEYQTTFIVYIAVSAYPY
uniref:Hemicentin 1 n=1 Tax=Cyprinus carpio TaxID=7962 RepID=A0A8C1I856_CYPCA